MKQEPKYKTWEDFFVDLKKQTLNEAADLIMSNHSGQLCDNEMSLKLRKKADDLGKKQD